MKLAVCLMLALSLTVNGIQYFDSISAKAHFAERIKYFYTYPYQADLVKERETGNIWLRLHTPSGFQVHGFGQVCPKEIKT